MNDYDKWILKTVRTRVRQHNLKPDRKSFIQLFKDFRRLFIPADIESRLWLLNDLEKFLTIEEKRQKEFQEGLDETE